MSLMYTMNVFVPMLNNVKNLLYEMSFSCMLCWFSVSFLSKFQLEDSILDFAEGLRVIGVRPDEKLALFADNSCRWLVADQGVQNFVYYLFIYDFT